MNDWNILACFDAALETKLPLSLFEKIARDTGGTKSELHNSLARLSRNEFITKTDKMVRLTRRGNAAHSAGNDHIDFLSRYWGEDFWAVAKLIEVEKHAREVLQRLDSYRHGKNIVKRCRCRTRAARRDINRRLADLEVELQGVAP